MRVLCKTIHTADTALISGLEIVLHNSNNNNQGHIEDTPENRLGVKTVVCTPLRILDFMRIQNMPNVKKFVYFFENPSYDSFSDIADLDTKNIRHLKIVDSTGNTLDNLILHAIARHRNLKTIELVQCNAIERDEVIEFIHQAHNLFPNFRYLMFNGEKFVYS